MSSSTLTEAELQQDRAPQLAASIGVFLAFSVIAVALRVYVRIFLARGFGLDDVTMVFALAFYAVYGGFVFTGIHYGTGQHAAALSVFNYEHAMRAWYFCEIFYNVASPLVRISIGIMLLRLTTINWHRITIYVVMLVSTLMSVILVMEIIFQCQPIKFFWSATRNPLHGHCIDSAVTIDFVYAGGAISCVCDWILGLLPWLLVRKLNMNLRTKVTVGVLLCLANFGSLAMLIRFYTINQLASSTDFLYDTTDLAIWSSLETGVAIPAASLITLRPLFRTFFGATRGTVESNSRPYHVSAMGGARGAGYIRQTTLTKSSSMAMRDIERGTTGKGDVTTTITADGIINNKDWGARRSSSSDPAGRVDTDEHPLQIHRNQNIDIRYGS
ncbi:putative polytopic membrane protein [Phaeomoniella chlamydospora]|uniref:Putative polytopic membrane protein n=1 Tax=Phaeomoniella chlamydospora TaxID=158046 RepID=A0A0G2DXM7_PHACM|nr:putative polytopic membrane protein [Phaeomoniella chlamydospora]